MSLEIWKDGDTVNVRDEQSTVRVSKEFVELTQVDIDTVDAAPAGSIKLIGGDDGNVYVVDSAGGKTAIVPGEQGEQGPPGDQGPAWQPTFESVASNLDGLPAVFNYTGDNLTSVVYTLPNASTITKTLSYTGDNLTSIVLSGATPNGINLTKTLSYTGENLTGVSYS